MINGKYTPFDNTIPFLSTRENGSGCACIKLNIFVQITNRKKNTLRLKHNIKRFIKKLKS